MKNSIRTGSYIDDLKKSVDRIEKRKAHKIVRSAVFFLILIAVCAGGVIIGALSKSSALEDRYKVFSETPEIASADMELLSYKDAAETVEALFLGNSPSQSLSGGFFCEKDGYSIYPDENSQSTILCFDGSEIPLSDRIAADINLKNGVVYYRNPETRRIYTYEIASGNRTGLDLENVGQFALYDSGYVYIDLSKASLEFVDSKQDKRRTLAGSGVKAFAVAGASILYLDENHTLFDLSLSDYEKTIIADNINAFSFNGSLWLQNGDKLMRKGLSEKEIEEYELGQPCHRLFAVTDKYIFYESDDGVHCHDIDRKSDYELGKGIFIGAINEKVLLYDGENNIFLVMDISV